MNIDEIEKGIMDMFREDGSRVGYIIPNNEIEKRLLNRRDPNGQTSLKLAIESLRNKGSVEIRKGGLALTQKGYDELY